MTQREHDTDAFPVVIIGGGLAGLTAAAHLAGRDVPPLVLEADSLWPGGRLSGGHVDQFEHNGRLWSFKPDHGVHAVWGNYLNLRATLDRFTDTELNPSIGEEWINRWKREVRAIEAGNSVRESVFPAPFHYLYLLLNPGFWRTIIPLDFISLPGYLFSTLWAVGFDPIKEKSALDGLLMKEFFRGWTPNLKASFRGLGTVLLAAPESEIPLSAFIAALRFFTILRRDAWQMAYFPGNSHDTIIQPLINTIRENGGEVLFGATAVDLKQEHGLWKITFEDTKRGGVRTLFAKHLILAVDAPAAERLLMTSEATQREAQRLIFPTGLRNTVIRLWFDAHPRPGTAGGMFTGDFVPDNFFWLHRLYEEFAEWRQAGGSAIELHLYGDDKLLDLPDRNLLVLAVDEVQRAFPGVRGHFVHGAVRRNSKVQTRFRIPTDDSLHVDTPWDNLYAAGDWIGCNTPSLWMERATITAIAAANRVLDAYNTAPYPILHPPLPGVFVRGLALLVRLIRLFFSPIVTLGRRYRRTQSQKQNL